MDSSCCSSAAVRVSSANETERSRLSSLLSLSQKSSELFYFAHLMSVVSVLKSLGCNDEAHIISNHKISTEYSSQCDYIQDELLYS